MRGPQLRRLSEIPGIGPRLASQLLSLYGSEAAAIQALREGRVEELASLLGSHRRALRLVQAARAAARGYHPGSVTATPETRKMLDQMLEILASMAASRPGRDTLLTLTPAPPGHVEPYPPCLSRAAGALDPGGRSEIRRILADLKWPKPLTRIKAEVPVAAPKGIAERLRVEAERHGIVLEILDPEDVDCESPGPPVLVAASSLEERGRCIAVEKLGPETLAPRAVMERLSLLQAAAEAIRWSAARAPSLLAEAAAALALDTAELRRVANEVARINELYRSGSLGEEHGRLREALNKLDSAISDLEVWLNEEARRRLEEREFRLTAAELLRLLQGIEEGIPRLPPEILEVFEELALEAEERLARQLGLGEEEAGFVAGIVKPEPRLPLQLDTERLERLRSVLSSKKAVLEYKALTKLAAVSLPLLRHGRALFEAALWIDQALACGSYAELIHGSMPDIIGEGTGVAVLNAREVELVSRHGADNVEPVSYVVGCTPYRPRGTRCERVTILTGANSGGKTTLLRLLAETVLAAQTGIPVPAEKAWVSPFNRIYFISKPSGTLSAGALETVLKQLAEIAGRALREPVLVLIDEFEAVTEAHAAARIVAALVEVVLASPGSAAVIVSHMPEEILRAIGDAAKNVRIDGIEAEGLDENYNLIVRRSPVYGRRARSTPELVVTRLLHRSKNRLEKQFYARVLEELRGAPNTARPSP